MQWSAWGRWGDAQEALGISSTELVTWSTLSPQDLVFYTFRCLQRYRWQCGFYLCKCRCTHPLSGCRSHTAWKSRRSIVELSYFPVIFLQKADTLIHFFSAESDRASPTFSWKSSRRNRIRGLCSLQPLMVFKSSAWLWLSLVAPWHQNSSRLFGEPEGWSLWQRKKDSRVTGVIWRAGSRLQEIFQPAHAGCPAQSVALCPASPQAAPCPFPCFVPCFLPARWATSQDAWWRGSHGCAGAGASSAFHLLSVSKPCPDCGWNTGWKKKQPLHECLVSPSIVFFYSFWS